MNIEPKDIINNLSLLDLINLRNDLNLYINDLKAAAAPANNKNYETLINFLNEIEINKNRISILETLELVLYETLIQKLQGYAII